MSDDANGGPKRNGTARPYVVVSAKRKRRKRREPNVCKACHAEPALRERVEGLVLYGKLTTAAKELGASEPSVWRHQQNHMSAYTLAERERLVRPIREEAAALRHVKELEAERKDQEAAALREEIEARKNAVRFVKTLDVAKTMMTSNALAKVAVMDIAQPGKCAACGQRCGHAEKPLERGDRQLLLNGAGEMRQQAEVAAKLEGLAGAMPREGTTVNVNVVMAEYIALKQDIVAVLAPYPDARRAVVEMMRRGGNGRSVPALAAAPADA